MIVEVAAKSEGGSMCASEPQLLQVQSLDVLHRRLLSKTLFCENRCTKGIVKQLT